MDLIEMGEAFEKDLSRLEKFETEIETLKAENKTLKLMLRNNSDIGISNEQLICETQIALLKERAIQKELNADEVRRFSQLFEVLEKIKASAVNVDDVVAQRMSDTELLQLVVNNDIGK